MQSRKYRPTRDNLHAAVIMLWCGTLLPAVSAVAVSVLPKWCKHYPWLIWLLVMLLGLMAALAQLRQHGTALEKSGGIRRGGDEEQLRRAQRELASAVCQQWTMEAQTRSLHRPRPLRVRWSSTTRPVAVAAFIVRGDAVRADRPLRLKLDGDLSDLVDKFRLLPARQLVVLGEPGAGKTVLAVLLTLGLINDLKGDDPVPVLLPLSSWKPHREHLYAWLARKLIEEYPGLASTAAYGPDAALRLVADGRIMPILDGFDELPSARHAAAIEALDRAVSGGRPLVLTCRSLEYEEAVLCGGCLARAAVVAIKPINLDDAMTFLVENRPIGDTKWRPVIHHLRIHRDGPLAKALSTPLMVSLARTSYNQLNARPAELLDSATFRDRASIEGRILDKFLPAVYAQRPLPEPKNQAPMRYPPEQATRWLAFLAHHLDREQTGDLAWWKLANCVPRPTRGLIFGLPAAMFFAGIGELAGGLTIALFYGIPAALAGCITNATLGRREPVRVEIRFRSTGSRFISQFAIGCAVGTALALGWSLAPFLTLLLCAIFGLAFGVHVWLDAPTDANRVSSPSIALRQDRLASLTFILSFALPLGLFYAIADTARDETRSFLVLHQPFGLLPTLAGAAAGAMAGRAAGGYLAIFTYALAGAAIAGPVFPGTSRLCAAVLGALFGCATGLAALPVTPWGAYLLSRNWLALRGRLPWRLMRFLADGHRRGVLRQSGAVYQFRHASLQDRLASKQ
jgi:hypothetical protein